MCIALGRVASRFQRGVLVHSEAQIPTFASVILFVHIHVLYSRLYIYISGTKLGIVALLLYLVTV
jgi:hypothetical protein